MEMGVKIDWSKRHKDLFQLLIGGAKTKLCVHCSKQTIRARSAPCKSISPLLPLRNSLTVIGVIQNKINCMIHMVCQGFCTKVKKFITILIHAGTQLSAYLQEM